MKETKQKDDQAKLESHVLIKFFQPKSSNEIQHGDKKKKKILGM